MTTQAASRPRLFQAMIEAFHQEDVRRKLMFTMAMLIVFRFVAHVPLPNIDRDALQTAFDNNSILDFLSIFSGGALQQLSVAALGVYPYITASIIMQILQPLVPSLRALQEEGEQGRRRLQMYTHWLAVPMAMVQGYGQIVFINSQSGGVPVVKDFGLQNDLMGTMATLFTVAAGTCSWSGLVSSSPSTASATASPSSSSAASSPECRASSPTSRRSRSSASPSSRCSRSDSPTWWSSSRKL
jgi:preprotein translocase subunit SecY